MSDLIQVKGSKGHEEDQREWEPKLWENTWLPILNRVYAFAGMNG